MTYGFDRKSIQVPSGCPDWTTIGTRTRRVASAVSEIHLNERAVESDMYRVRNQALELQEMPDGPGGA